MWRNLGVLVKAQAAELKTSWRRFVCVAGILSRRELHIVNFTMNERSSNGAGNSLINSITNTSKVKNKSLELSVSIHYIYCNICNV